jgi:DNA polymerase I-like protein with 3'-5' exonuclease and polymerase domains
MTYALATSLRDVEEYLEQDHPQGWMGMDTEASALDTRRAHLAGISISLKAGTAIYMPTGHKIGTNLPIMPVWERIEKKLETHRPIFHNAKYDLTILQVATGGRQPRKYGDSIEVLYLANPNRKNKDLKTVCREEFGMPLEKFETIFSDEERRSGTLDITTKSPATCTDYACGDPDGTLRIWEKYAWVEEKYPMRAAIDHRLIDIVRKIEHNGGFELNHDYIDQQIEALGARAQALQEQIWRTVGYEFPIESPKQLGTALYDKLAIPNQGMTKGKNPIPLTNEDVLDKLKRDHPIVELVISYKKTVKAKGSYFEKLKRLDNLRMKPRFSFHMFAAPTFRFAAPGGNPKKDGFTGVNIQAISKGEVRDIMGVDLSTAEEIDHYLSQVGKDELLFAPDDTDLTPELHDNLQFEEPTKLPWVLSTEADTQVCFRETCAGCPARCKARGIDTTRRLQKNVLMLPSVRQCFRAPKGWKVVSFDYDRQEMIIGANMSGEPRWLRALAAGEDLHLNTAAAAFSTTPDLLKKLPKQELEKKRGAGKTLNFATFFGATAYSLAAKADIPLAQAEQIYNNFVKEHPVLMGWIAKVHIFARKNGYTTTWFGTERPLKEFYDTGNPKMIAFANRSAVNTAVQGTGAEVTRIAMVRTDKRLTDAGFTGKEIKFAIQLHDDLTFLARDEVIDDVVPIIKDGMELKISKWQVQLTVEAKVGDIWGSQEKYRKAA